MKEKKLNTRQWKLYNYVKFLSMTNRTTDKEDICNNVEGYTLEVASNSIKNCSQIYQDIKAINNSSEIEKIIVVDKNVIRLGNEQECLDYANKLYNKAMKLLSRYGIIVGKVRKDGQYKIVSCHGDVITPESKARQFVEAFINNDSKNI